ncbi:MAG TPA: phenylalanine--tRNA ligase subunit beta [Phycisphaerae bacterium]|nr:phenylalanine--tRNA ligase subunit beta [Phycisphaerae bacterium]
MKIAMDWIGEYVAPGPSAEVAGEALMNAGLPVESVEEAEGAKGPTKVLDVEVTSNRTDCFCHVGLARELAALTGGKFRPPAAPVFQADTGAAAPVSVRVQAGAGCPYYSARVIRGVKVGPSPEWMQKRLLSIGLRPVNNVVDVTNYVLMELGQPLHAFDLDKLEDQRIVVRMAHAGEKMEAIDGKTYALSPTMLVIGDGAKAVAIAGVMGGKATEVNEGTVNILLESARFDPLSVRTTSRALGLKSDSSYRFERGIDPAMAEVASRRAAQMIVQVAGGTIVPGVAVEGTEAVHGARAITVRMRLKRFEQIMGYRISADRGLAILCALGFSAGVDEEEGGRDLLYTRVPTHRLDVDREIDLIEEIARVEGYGHVPTLDRVTHPVAPEPAREKAARAARRALVEAGFSEAVTVTFVPEAEGRMFAQEGETLIHPQHEGWKADVLRPSLLPSLLAVRRTNQNVGIGDARVFETAEIFVQRGDVMKEPPTQRAMLAAVAGDVEALTGMARVVVEAMNPEARVWVEPAERGCFVKGAAGRVWLEVGGKREAIGWVGVFSPEVVKRFDLRGEVGGVEVSWEALVGAYEPVRRARAVPRFPGVKRDLSVVVAEGVRWAEVEKAIEEAKLKSLAKVEFVTTFRGKGVEAGKKSLTLALEFREAGRTLTSEEVDAEVKKAVGVLEERFGAVLRG